MTVRELRATDATSMADIHAASFETGWPALDMAVHTERDLCFGLDAEDGLASFVIIRRSGRESEILTIATHPTQRGGGLARRVLEAAHQRLSSEAVETVFLEVAEDNLSAITLYKSLGYQPIGRRPGYYRRRGGRVAALTLSLTLDAGRTWG